MPIANCVITPECIEGSSNLIELWSSESNLSSEHMTINLITSTSQLGNKYRVMTNLLLPSIWSSSDISLLQTGLAKALAQYFKLDINDVHIVTTIIESGMVVESGKQIVW